MNSQVVPEWGYVDNEEMYTRLNDDAVSYWLMSLSMGADFQLSDTEVLLGSGAVTAGLNYFMIAARYAGMQSAMADVLIGIKTYYENGDT